MRCCPSSYKVVVSGLKSKSIPIMPPVTHKFLPPTITHPANPLPHLPPFVNPKPNRWLEANGCSEAVVPPVCRSASWRDGSISVAVGGLVLDGSGPVADISSWR